MEETSLQVNISFQAKNSENKLTLHWCRNGPVPKRL